MAPEAPLTDIDAFTHAAQAFASRLSETVQAVAGNECPVFTALVSTEGRIDAAIRQHESRGVLLTKSGRALLRLDVAIYLESDHVAEHLKVVRSEFKVFPEGGRVPVFRYEFNEEQRPAAHVQFHGRHEELEQLMVQSGRTRSRSTSKNCSRPNITDLHFPVGGSRFRPCLEDVLEMLINEFEIDTEPDRRTVVEALQEGRADWRNRQLRTAMRDDPETAADQLRKFGYIVSWPEDREPLPRRDHVMRML